MPRRLARAPHARLPLACLLSLVAAASASADDTLSLSVPAGAVEDVRDDDHRDVDLGRRHALVGLVRQARGERRVRRGSLRGGRDLALASPASDRRRWTRPSSPGRRTILGSTPSAATFATTTTSTTRSPRSRSTSGRRRPRWRSRRPRGSIRASRSRSPCPRRPRAQPPPRISPSSRRHGHRLRADRRRRRADVAQSSSTPT